ncbi:MAG: hypothetical protein QG600_462 [Patescibacteria group bacterium]|jgi:hypothetical protein|nr:hypothetical protein [Patescibacteria group bacterium]
MSEKFTGMPIPDKDRTFSRRTFLKAMAGAALAATPLARTSETYAANNLDADPTVDLESDNTDDLVEMPKTPTPEYNQMNREQMVEIVRLSNEAANKIPYATFKRAIEPITFMGKYDMQQPEVYAPLWVDFGREIAESSGGEPPNPRFIGSKENPQNGMFTFGLGNVPSAVNDGDGRSFNFITQFLPTGRTEHDIELTFNGKKQQAIADIIWGHFRFRTRKITVPMYSGIRTGSETTTSNPPIVVKEGRAINQLSPGNLTEQDRFIELFDQHRGSAIMSGTVGYPYPYSYYNKYAGQIPDELRDINYGNPNADLNQYFYYQLLDRGLQAGLDSNKKGADLVAHHVDYATGQLAQENISDLKGILEEKIQEMEETGGLSLPDNESILASPTIDIATLTGLPRILPYYITPVASPLYK